MFSLICRIPVALFVCFVLLFLSSFVEKESHCVALTGPKLTDLPAYASQALGFKVCDVCGWFLFWMQVIEPRTCVCKKSTLFVELQP